MTANAQLAVEPRVRPHAWYGLALLSAINIFNYVDRTVIGVLLQSIKFDLNLSDTQIGLITGFAFALFYAFAGLAIAYLADIGSRRLVIGLSILVWSAMTACTGAATSFFQLFLARMGIGIGEAGAIPAGNSLIADWFPPSRRPLAMAAFGAGVFFGIMGGSWLGGYVGQHYGWRWAFVAAGIPGVPLALLALFTLREPTRGEADGIRDSVRASLGETVRALLANAPYVYLIAAFAFITFLIFGVVAWFPSFMIRTYGMSEGQVGFYFGTALGIGTAIGSVIGGVIANALARRSLRWLTLLPVFLSFFFLPLFEGAVFAPTAALSFLMIALVSSIGGAILGPVLSAIQTVVPAHMRTSASGLNGVAFSIIGHGGAPLLIGMLSDHFAGQGLSGPLALKYALAIAIAVGFLATVFLILAHRAYARRLGGVQQMD